MRQRKGGRRALDALHSGLDSVPGAVVLDVMS